MPLLPILMLHAALCVVQSAPSMVAAGDADAAIDEEDVYRVRRKFDDSNKGRDRCICQCYTEPCLNWYLMCSDEFARNFSSDYDRRNLSLESRVQ